MPNKTNETMKDGERAAFEAEEAAYFKRWENELPPLDGCEWDRASPQSGEKGQEIDKLRARMFDWLTSCTKEHIDGKIEFINWVNEGFASIYARAAAPQAALDEIVYAVQAYGDARADGGNSADAIGKVCNLLRALSQAPTEHTSAASPQPFVIEENERDGNWREFSVNGHGGFIRVVARMEDDSEDLPLGEQVAQWLLSGGARGEVDFSDGEVRNAYYAGFKEGEASAAETQAPLSEALVDDLYILTANEESMEEAIGRFDGSCTGEALKCVLAAQKSLRATLTQKPRPQCSNCGMAVDPKCHCEAGRNAASAARNEGDNA